MTMGEYVGWNGRLVYWLKFSSSGLPFKYHILLVVEWSFVSSFGLVASFFSALVLLHFHLVSTTYESVGGCYNRE